MDDMVIARAVHVVAVVLWIGGVAFVTTILMPAIRRTQVPAARLELFETFENRFAWQARVTTVLVGLSGLHMVHGWNLWDRFASTEYWWMHAMVLVWAIFTFMLFVAEPLFLHKKLKRRAAEDPEGTFRLVTRLHWVLLTVSLITVAGAVAGAHGG